MYKTDALKSLLLKINPYLDIRTDCVKVTDDNLQELFADATIVCEALIIRKPKQCWSMEFWNISQRKSSYPQPEWLAMEAAIPLSQNGSRKTFICGGDGVTAPTYGHGLMAPRVAICAAHEANMITRLILGEEEI